MFDDPTFDIYIYIPWKTIGKTFKESNNLPMSGLFEIFEFWIFILIQNLAKTCSTVMNAKINVFNPKQISLKNVIVIWGKQGWLKSFCETSFHFNYEFAIEISTTLWHYFCKDFLIEILICKGLFHSKLKSKLRLCV